MFVDKILDDVFPDETGARLQQIGLFTLIFVLEQRGETVTAARLAELTGKPSAVYKQLEKLDEIEVIKRAKKTDKRRRGFTYVLSIRHNDKTRRLVEALVSRRLAKRRLRGGARCRTKHVCAGANAVIDRKKTREKLGYTATSQNKNPTVWFWLARGFRAAAEVLHDNEERIPRNSRPFALNAGYSLELLFKGLIAQKGLGIPSDASGHDLRDLSAKAGVKLTKDQLTTLEEFKEIIVWLGRYPGPNKEERWDHYHDVLLEKNVLRATTTIDGKTVSSVRANPATFSSWENYKRIWDIGFEMVDAKIQGVAAGYTGTGQTTSRAGPLG